jgi:hypothetical protein
MSIRFTEKLDALMVLCDADAEHRHDIEDGFVPETPMADWQRAVATLPSEEHADLLLIALMNSGLVEANPVVKDTVSAGTTIRTALVYEYVGVTNEGRALAVEHGWVDTD